MGLNLDSIENILCNLDAFLIYLLNQKCFHLQTGLGHCSTNVSYTKRGHKLRFCLEGNQQSDKIGI